jgi:hypothetical protein
MKPDDFVLLQELIEQRYREYAGALVTFAVELRSDKGEPRLITCRWLFSDHVLEARSAREYPSLYLGEDWYGGADAVDALGSVLKGEKRLGSARCDPTTTYLGQPSERRTGTISGWREIVVDARIEHSGSPPFGPVAAKGLPPHSTGRNAVSGWVWAGVTTRLPGEVPHSGMILVVLPDTRGRITAAEWSGDTLSLEAEVNVDSELLETQVNVGTGGESVTLSTERVSAASQWDIPAEATMVDAFLVHTDGTLLSFLQLTRGEHYTAHGGKLSVREQAEVDLRAGESDRIEYKPFVEPTDQKEWELIETIVAFANTSGGRLYVGVNNAGIPVGEAQMRKVIKTDIDNALHVLATRIKELIQERTKPGLSISVEPLSIFGSWIIVVDVPAGERGPYSTIQNDVYIRKGASNFKADPVTELPSLYTRVESAKTATARTLQTVFGRRGL